VSIILASGLSPLAEPFTEQYIQLVFLTGLLAGIMQLLMAAFRLGDLTKFLSKPVLKGFVAGNSSYRMFYLLYQLILYR